MAAFAVGEVESITAADAILKVLGDARTPSSVRARSVEAAGKIAAANPKAERAKSLAAVIVSVLDLELRKSSATSVEVAGLGLTAALRARPAGAEEVIR